MEEIPELRSATVIAPEKNPRTMFKLIMAILVMTAPIVASAQCIFKVDVKDPITNQQVKRHYFYLSGSFEITISRHADNFEFMIDFALDGEQNFRVLPGSKTIIKLSSGESIEILNNNSASPTTQFGRRITSRYKLTHSVSLDFYRRLASSSVEHIRVELQDQLIDAPVKSRVGEKISKYADCIVQ